MHHTANVYLWGTHVGTVSLVGDDPIARFQYTDEFRGMGVELSPLRMPLSPAVFAFPDLPVQSFYGLPGLLSDSLPDKFGNKVIAAWLREQNKRPEDLNAIDRLCYTGQRGMAARTSSSTARAFRSRMLAKRAHARMSASEMSSRLPFTAIWWRDVQSPDGL